MSLPFVVSEAVWNAKNADETVALKSDFERCQVTVVEITTAAFSGKIDIQGKLHELSAFCNVPYIRQDQAGIQTPSVAQIDHTTDTGVVRYVILGYWRRLQLVMTRTAGTITCGVAGSSDAKVFPYLPTKLIANSGVNIGDVNVLSIAAGSNIIGKVGIDQTTPGTTNKVAVDGTKETAVSQETGAVGTVGWLSSIKGFLANLKTYIGATDAAIVAAGAVGSVTAKLRRVTQGLEDLLTGITLAGITITKTIETELKIITAVAADAQSVSSTLALTNMKKATIYIDHGRDATAAFVGAGTEYRIEASEKATGDDTWRTIASVEAVITAALGHAMDEEKAPGTTVILIGATTPLNGDIQMFKNATIANSEWAKIVAVDDGVSFTIQDGLTNTQAAITTYSKGEHFVLTLDVTAFTRLRVVCNNINGSTNQAIVWRCGCISQT